LHARCASDLVLKRQATSRKMSSRTASIRRSNYL
jgi:hypothetical protein